MVAMASVPGVVSADDHWGDSMLCNGPNPVVDTTGEYSGTLISPGDVDSFEIQVEQGDYISVRAVATSEAEDPVVRKTHTWITTREEEGLSSMHEASVDTHRATLFPGEEGTWEIWPEEDDTLCIAVFDRGGGDVPYEWKINLEENNPEPATFETTELENEVSQLEDELVDKENQIDDLESELVDKENEIEALEEKIADLEAELEDADVTIDVSVEPADQATFQVGGEMRVEVDAEGTASSDVALDFAGQQYTPSDGEAIIPLESAGTQDLSIEYEGMTEVVTLDVATDDDTQPDTDEETVGDDTPPDTDEEAIGDEDQVATDDIPGFGFITALIALAGLLLLSRRQ